MELSTVFGGDSLKAADLQGGEHSVVISDVSMKKFDNGNKLVISFQGRKKTLVCNKTNAARIAHFYGSNTDGWIGKEVILYPDLVDFQGKAVEAIRIKAPLRRAPAVGGNGNGTRHVVTDHGSFKTSEMRREPDGIEEATGVRTRDPAEDSEIPF